MSFDLAKPIAIALGVMASPSLARAEPTPSATLYVFFATWCTPCRDELPAVEQLHHQYAARGLQLVLVAEEATDQDVPAFLARANVSSAWVLDRESRLLERYNPQATVPFAVLVDRSGGVAYSHAGYSPGDERLLDQAIQRMLAGVRPESELVWASTYQTLGIFRTSRFDPVASNDGQLRGAVGRATASAAAPEFQASVRVDGGVLDDDAMRDGQRIGLDHDLRLERVRGAAVFGPVEVVAGDEYVQFGQGVSLSLRKVDPLGVDTTLLGGRTSLDWRGIQGTLIGGWTNPQNLDPIALRFVDDVDDRIVAGQVVALLAERVRAGPYAVFVRAPGASTTGGTIDWSLGGGSIAVERERVKLAVDAAAGKRSGVALTDETAWAAFATSQVVLGSATVRLAGKAYRHWEIGRPSRSIAYHEPPSLEIADQEVPGNEDSVGGSGRVEYRVTDDLTLLGNAVSYLFTQDDSSPVVDGKLASHLWLGGEKRFDKQATAALGVGYRREQQADGALELEMAHGEVDGSLALSDELALTAKWVHREERKPLLPLEFRRGLAVLGLSWSGIGVVSFLYGYSTERSTAPTQYPGGELLVHLGSHGSIRLFVGNQLGGRVCVSGTCRDVPGYRGVRLEVVLRFGS